MLIKLIEYSIYYTHPILLLKCTQPPYLFQIDPNMICPSLILSFHWSLYRKQPVPPRPCVCIGLYGYMFIWEEVNEAPGYVHVFRVRKVILVDSGFGVGTCLEFHFLVLISSVIDVSDYLVFLLV